MGFKGFLFASHCFLNPQLKQYLCFLISNVYVVCLFQEADLVTTHELGHNFGAEHDPDNIPICAPSDDLGGKFVMYPIAVSGDHVNNKVHSSIRQKRYSLETRLLHDQLCSL